MRLGRRRRAVHDAAVVEPERRPVPWTHDTALATLDLERALRQWAGQVRALVGKNVDVLPAPHDQQVDTSHGALGQLAVRKVVEPADALPAGGEEVEQVGRVVDTGRLAEREMAAEVAAGHHRAEAHERQSLAADRAPAHPRRERRAVEAEADD